MSDEADQADGIIQAATEAAIDRARTPGSQFPHLKPRGWCHWCGDPVGPDRLHCAPVENDCAAVHLRYINFRKGEQ